MNRALVLCFAFVLAGCPKSQSDDPKPAPSASTPIAVASSSAAPAASSAAPAAGSAPAGAAAAWTGTYTLAPAKMYISDTKDFERVKQVKDDPTQHVGDGTLSIDVGADGRVTGTIDAGPASPAIIDGSVVDGEIRCTVRRKTIADNGLTGTFTAKSTGEDGKLALAEANAAIVREGKVTLKKK